MARGACKVVSINGPLTVTFTSASGVTPTVFTDEACTSSTALPATVADGANSTFYFASPGSYTLSVKTAAGIQIAGDLNTTRIVTVSAGDVGVYAYDTRLVTRDASGDSGRHSPNTDLAATYVAGTLPEAFGAVGDGTTDDTAALQAAHDALDATYGGRIWLSAGKLYNFTALNITKPRVTIDGPGVLYNGTVNVGVQSGYAPVEMNTTIRCGFDRSARSTTVDAISVANSRFVDVLDCRVNNYRAFVSFPALSLGGTNEQHSARVRISGTKVPYGLIATAPIDYLVYVNGNTTGGMFSVGDITVTNNPAVFCNIAHIYSTGGTGAIDGLVCNGNTFFFPPYTRANAVKLSHVLLTVASDMVNIVGNQFFEAGYESINMTDPRNLVIQGNNLIWSGQRDLKDAIALTISGGGYARGIVSANNISFASNTALSIYGTGDASGLTIGANTTLLSNSYPQYYGIPTLPATFTRYGGASGLASQPRLLDTANESGNATTDTLGTVTTETLMRLGIRSSLSSRAKTVSVTVPATVVGTFGSATGSTTAYGGILVMAVADTGGTHLANYVIAVGGDATAQTITVLAADGETGGAAATAPSFTWTINASNQLLASPVGSASGSFNFWATPLGNLRFT